MGQFNFTVNGEPAKIEAPENMPLLWVIRDLLGLTGTKYSCGIGRCGTCTVHVDGLAARSCMIQINSIEGKSITTIEGLSNDKNLHPVQQAWLEERVSQCGFCQPGMIMQAASLIQNNPDYSLQELELGMSGNLCRCGTQPRVRKALTKLSGGKHDE